MSDNYQNKENQGAIFKNTKKQNEKHPDYRGTVNVEGKEFEIALWLKKSQNGKPYFGVKVSEPYQKPEGNTNRPAPVPAPIDTTDDDLPF